MIQDTRLQGKLEQRFFAGLCLGKDTHTNESILGIPGKIIRARTIRRQVMPEKYNRQLMDTINVYPINPTRRTVAELSFMPLPRTPGTTAAQATETSTQTIEIEETPDAPTTHAPQSSMHPHSKTGNHGPVTGDIANVTAQQTSTTNPREEATRRYNRSRKHSKASKDSSTSSQRSTSTIFPLKTETT